MRDDCYREHIEEEKLRVFDYIVDMFMEEDMTYQKKMSIISDALQDYVMYHGGERE